MRNLVFPTYRVFRRTVRFTNADGVRDSLSFHDSMLKDGEIESSRRAEWSRLMEEHVTRQRNGLDVECEITERATRQTWALTWFGHWTFRCDEIPDSEAALASFEQFVSEVERQHPQDAPLEERHGKDWICLMGAEERWRWRGDGPDDPAPCECQHCVDQGVWRIGH